MIKSDDIKEIAIALSKAQAEMKEASKDGKNTFFNNAKYATLASFLTEAKPILSKHGLSVIQLPETINEKTCMTSLLLHTSGQYIGSTFELLIGKQDMQGFGSATTYARRYAFAALVGMAPEDDDGNETSNQSNNQPVQSNKPQFAPNYADLGTTIFPTGKFKDKAFKDIKPDDLLNYAEWMKSENDKKSGKPSQMLEAMFKYLEQLQVIPPALDDKIPF